jgi:diaminopimelate epimerase
MDEGNLSEETSSLTVWGRDRATGTMYCGTAAVTVVP